MRRPLSPLFLHQPGRFAQIGRGPARAILLALVVAAIALAGAAGPSPDLGRQAGFYSGLADSLRHGDGAYYAAAAAALRGSELPVTATAFPAPAGAHVAALSPLLVSLSLGGLTVAVILAWFDRFRRAGGRFNLVVPLIMLAGMGMGRGGLPAMPQIWAGFLLTPALGLWRPDRWLEPAALALAAAIITPAALPVLAVMAVAAWHDRRRPELVGWVLALVIAAVILGVHLAAASEATGFGAESESWQPVGLIVALQTLGAATGLSILPDGFALVLTGLAAIGWLTWRTPLASRVFATGAAILLITALLPAERSADILVLSPLLWLGLIPAIEALRDLGAAALDTRRITVRRVVR